MSHKERYLRLSASILALSVLFTSACTAPEKAAVIRQPSTAPVKTISSFSEALRCMDTLLWKHGKQDIYVTSNGVPDETGRLLGGTKEMLITAISRMSERSNAFSFVDFEPALDSVNALYWMVGVRPEFRAPSYYVRGAITQLDENVIAEAASAGISLPKVDLAISADQIVSMISVDLSVGELVTRRILPGVTASNSIAVVSSGRGADAGGMIHKAGLSFNVSLNRSEGMHQAVRTLIELSAIEVLGKLARVPYWQCLGIEQTNPAYMAQARSWYDDMSPAERVTFAQRVLRADGYYDGATDGNDDAATRAAVGRYQADHDLIATGRVDFDLYYRMLGSATARALPPVEQGRPKPAEPETASFAAPDVILASDRGPQPTYRPGEALVVRAQTTADGFLYCYYADGDGSVARIFPNRFQPDPFLAANTQVEIPPGPQRPFNIRMDQPGAREQIACVASPHEVGMGLPEQYKAADLEVIPQASLNDVLRAFAALPNTVVRSRSMQVAVLPGGG
ncbi:MAG: DUF4384 domain-containing protein [Rhodospirillales bacterium]|nr:DUF4384 domain-containing protein [Rhodospirillales bacterium]